MKFPAFEPINLTNYQNASEIIELSLEQIIPDENQCRKIFEKNSLAELASSIKQHGVIQPVIVRKIDGINKYQLIAGERRCRAAKIAGLETIPAVIRLHDKSERMTIALIENIQRENLNPLEEARAIETLLARCSLTHSQVAASIGRSRAAVSNLLRLLNLDDEVQEMIHAGFLEMGHAKALLGLPSQYQAEIAKIIISKTLSVREVEKLVQSYDRPKKKQNTLLNLELEEKAKSLKVYLTNLLLSKVEMCVKANGRGKIVIRFDSLKQVECLMKNLGVNEL